VTIRVGFYGTGLISQMHCFFLADSGVDHAVVAVHDPDADRAAKAAVAHGAVAVGEDELLDLVDAVYVTTWTSEHPRLVEKVAARGLAVFCEKPLAVDAPTAEHMVDVVTDAGVINQVGLILRSWAPFPLLRDLVHDERAGKVLAVVFRDDQYIPIQGQYGSDWRKDPARAGRGALLEHSIHDLDVLAWLLGPVRSVCAVMREVHGLPRIDDVAVVRLDFASGAVASLTSVWHDVLERPSNRRVEIFCERMFVAIEGDLVGPVRFQLTGEAEQCLEGAALRDALRARGDDVANPAAAFLAAVRDGTRADPDFAAALPAHRLADAVYASADAGGARVELP
jgi:1,5-anhydro-D-fructose reductase (1,5-anhydro-D-mannitol-forming)